jgi:hypothetical protein
MGVRSGPERDSEVGHLREGHFKEPVEGLIVFWILNMINEAVSVETGGVLGTIEAVLLWIVVGYLALTLYDIGHGRVGNEMDEQRARTFPDPKWGFGLTLLGVSALALFARFGIDPIAGWITSVALGPGTGVPVGSSGGVVMFWVIVATVAAESLSRGLDKLFVRYIGRAKLAIARRRAGSG